MYRSLIALVTVFAAACSTPQRATDYLEENGFENVTLRRDGTGGYRFQASLDEAYCSGTVRTGVVTANAYVCGVPSTWECHPEFPESCAGAAESVRASRPYEADALLMTGCAHGFDAACQGWVDDSDKEFRRREAGLIIGCGRGDGGACTNLGVLLGRRGELSAAAVLHGRACDLGIGTACGNLAELHDLYGDESEVEPLMKRACKLGFEKACNNDAS